MSGGYFVVGACFTCGRMISFNPHLVPSIPIDPANGKPADMGGDATKTVRQPICSDCVEVANLIRKREGREQIDVLDGAYDFVEGLPELSFLARRVDAVTAMIKASHPDVREIVFVLVRCDHCGVECEASNMRALDVKLKREGWVLDGDRPPYLDLCAACSS